jgi:hypothetical protein
MSAGSTVCIVHPSRDKGLNSDSISTRRTCATSMSLDINTNELDCRLAHLSFPGLSNTTEICLVTAGEHTQGPGILEKRISEWKAELIGCSTINNRQQTKADANVRRHLRPSCNSMMRERTN